MEKSKNSVILCSVHHRQTRIISSNIIGSITVTVSQSYNVLVVGDFYVVCRHVYECDGCEYVKIRKQTPVHYLNVLFCVERRKNASRDKGCVNR
jgi:hypothetical protein